MRFPTISKASDEPAHMHSLIRVFASRLNKLLTEHRLEFVSLKGGCTGSSESTLVKMRHCVAAQFMIYWLRTDAYDSYLGEKENSDKYHKSSFSCMQCAVSCSSSLKLFCFFHANP